MFLDLFMGVCVSVKENWANTEGKYVEHSRAVIQSAEPVTEYAVGPVEPVRKETDGSRGALAGQSSA